MKITDRLGSIPRQETKRGDIIRFKYRNSDNWNYAMITASGAESYNLTHLGSSDSYNAGTFWELDLKSPDVIPYLDSNYSHVEIITDKVELLVHPF